VYRVSLTWIVVKCLVIAPAFENSTTNLGIVIDRISAYEVGKDVALRKSSVEEVSNRVFVLSWLRAVILVS
jgi:hypothetical protein